MQNMNCMNYCFKKSLTRTYWHQLLEDSLFVKLHNVGPCHNEKNNCQESEIFSDIKFSHVQVQKLSYRNTSPHHIY